MEKWEQTLDYIPLMHTLPPFDLPLHLVLRFLEVKCALSDTVSTSSQHVGKMTTFLPLCGLSIHGRPPRFF
jgi:hypothetical protein